MALSPKSQDPTHCDLLSLLISFCNLTTCPRNLIWTAADGQDDIWRHWRQWQLKNMAVSQQLSALKDTLRMPILSVSPCQAACFSPTLSVALGGFTESELFISKVRGPSALSLRSYCSLLQTQCDIATRRFPRYHLPLRSLLLCFQWRCGEHQQLPGSRLVGTDPRLVAQRRGNASR